MEKVYKEGNFSAPNSGITLEHGFSLSTPSVLGDFSPSPGSITNAFLLGIHNFEALDGVNLPDFVKEHQATLTFPEKLMLMLTYVEKESKTDDPQHNLCIFWNLNERAFVIKSKEKFVTHLLPLFFRQSKFPSFTRKLYRWGFRQVSTDQELSSCCRREMMFGHEFFQRDNKSLMAGMRSITAAGTRRAVAAMSLQRQKNIANHDQKLLIRPKNLSTAGAVRHHVKEEPTNYENIQMEKNIQPTLPSSHYPLSSSDFVLSIGQTANQSSDVSIEDDNEKQGRIYQSCSPTQTKETKKASECSLPKFPDLECPSSSHSTFSTKKELTRTKLRRNSGGKSTDPNKHMLAAVDLLLRYASQT